MTHIVSSLLAKFLIGLMAGMLVGYDRLKKGKVAGVRTHAIVSSSCALIVGASLESFAALDSTSRVVTGILQGIGFIGAGQIFMNKDTVKGLTTAAGIWGSAVLGVMAGLGYYTIALLGALSIYVLLKTHFIRDNGKGRRPVFKEEL